MHVVHDCMHVVHNTSIMGCVQGYSTSVHSLLHFKIVG